MAKRTAVLDWHDIQVLVELATCSVEKRLPNWGSLEAARMELVSGLLVYLEQWFPGKFVDDEARIKLVHGIKTYLDHFEPDAANAQALGEAKRIRERLIEVMRLPLQAGSKLDKGCR